MKKEDENEKLREIEKLTRVLVEYMPTVKKKKINVSTCPRYVTQKIEHSRFKPEEWDKHSKTRCKRL